MRKLGRSRILFQQSFKLKPFDESRTNVAVGNRVVSSESEIMLHLDRSPFEDFERDHASTVVDSFTYTVQAYT